MATSKFTLNAIDRRVACEAWERSGCLGLSLWLLAYQKRRKRVGFTVAEYGELVSLVRAALGDDTDYSKED